MVYRFGIFEADTESVELRRKGLLVRIQEQPMRLLIALLEAQGQVVSKEQLRCRLWAQGVHVELDGALSVALAKLREALGDDAASPRFIKTVPRRGYRFIAPIETICPQSAPAELPHAPEQPTIVKSSGHLSKSATVSLTALVLVAAFATYLWMHAKSRHSPVHSLIVTDFTNSTGDAVFDGSLRRAVIVQLSQSPWLHIDSDSAIDSALQSLNRPPAQGHVTPAMARQACQPLQADAILVGSLSRQGTDNYLIGIESYRCGDSQRLSRAFANVKGRDDVLGRLGQMLVGVRRDLGESRNTVERFNIPLEQATTDSLDALNAYHVGYDLRNRGHGHEAIPFFRAAVLLDPKFAMAYQELGSVYSNIGEVKIGSGFVQKAFDLRGRTTEPERYLISGRYFDVVTGEIPKALSIYSLWHSTYPSEWAPLNAYANDLNLLGQYAGATQMAQQAIERDPNHAFGYANLALSLMGANRFVEAEQVCSEALAKNRTSTILERVHFELAFVTGDTDRIRAAAAGMKDELDRPYWLAESAASQGKLKEAKQLFADAAALAHGAGLPGIESSDLGGEAITLALFGETDKARALAHQAISEQGGEAGYGEPMVVLAMLGDSPGVASIRWKMDRAYPVSEYNLDVYRPMADGLLSGQRRANSAQILEIMAPAVPYQLGQYAALLPVYIRATLLAEAGNAEAAGRQFQHVLDNRGVDPTSPLLPMSHLGLARAHRETKQLKESCTEYQEFLREWKDADPEIPVLRAARYEARLCLGIH